MATVTSPRAQTGCRKDGVPGLVYAYDRMYCTLVDFTWDESKRQANLAKHGLDFADAAKVFAGPMVLFEDDRVDYGEQRMIGVGLLDYLVVLIVHVEG